MRAVGAFALCVVACGGARASVSATGIGADVGAGVRVDAGVGVGSGVGVDVDAGVSVSAGDGVDDAGVSIRFGHPLPDAWLRCAHDDDCAVAMGLYCWPMAVNRAYEPEVSGALGRRLERGERCSKPGCGIEFHEARCRAQHCKLIDGCPGGAR